jgi:hypothetical protein
MASRDMVTRAVPLLDVASGDTVDLLGSESNIIGLNVINTTTVTLTEGSDSGGVGATAVAAKYIILGPADAGSLAANVVTYAATGFANIGYVGHQRYLTITVANPATDTTIVVYTLDMRNNPDS